MKRITIIGYGRFGKVLHRLLKDDFSVVLYNRSPISEKNLGANTRIAKDLGDAYESDIIFFAVPIPAFESVVRAHKRYFRPHHLLVDVLSVKMHPALVFRRELRGLKTRALLTHPMFGPDSSKEGFSALPLIIDRGSATPAEVAYWKSYFRKKKLRVIELSPKEHDKLAANSQGLTHFIGRLLEKLGVKAGPIDSLGTKKLLEVEEQTCNDTWELFAGLQHYNPYTKRMRLRLGAAYDSLYGKLLPKAVRQGVITIGIQGGKGSFNDEAIQEYIRKRDIRNFDIKYLYTAEKVLRNLYEGNIDLGLFATHNARGGIVHESVHAMARYKFRIVDEQAILIRHSLMRRSDVRTEDVMTIMGHSQNFKQCAVNLAAKFSSLEQVTGKGDLVDTAKAASCLAAGKLPKTTAILGPRVLATMYGFEIIEGDLQDLGKDNITNFLLVKR